MTLDVGTIAKDAAAGAAAGSIVPGVGTVLGAAGAVAMDLAPEISKWLFGPGAEKTVNEVKDVLTKATGTENPADQVIALADPALSVSVRIQLAQIAADREAEQRQNDLAALQAVITDVANARDQTQNLAKMGSSIAFGAPIISIIITLSFGITLFYMMYTPADFSPGKQNVLSQIIGALTLAFGTVVNYWMGTSMGSVRKTDILAAALASNNSKTGG